MNLYRMLVKGLHVILDDDLNRYYVEVLISSCARLV